MKSSLGVRLANYLFRLGALLLASSLAAVMVFGDAATIKSALRDSGAYQAVADSLVGQASRSLQGQLGSNPLVDSAAAETAIRESLPPQAIQEQSEQSIDGIYAWLNGRTAQPELRFDLQPSIDTLAGKLSDQAADRAAGLPACTPEQVQRLLSDGMDISSLGCAPPGIGSQSARQLISDQLGQTGGILSDPVLTTDNLPKDSSGQTAVDRLAVLPEIFQWLGRLPLISAGLLLAGAALVYWQQRTEWRQAARTLARSLLGVGILLLVLAGLTRLFFMNATDPSGYIGKLVGGGFSEVIVTFVSSLEKAFSIRLLIFGGAYALLATAVLLLLRWRQPKLPSSTSETKLASK